MMTAEFSIKIEEGIIRIPVHLETYNDSFARVILITEESASLAERKRKLKEVVMKMQEISAFNSVDDPVVWQRQVRDEWN